jgi:hypothetical protein
MCFICGNCTGGATPVGTLWLQDGLGKSRNMNTGFNIADGANV